MLTAADSTRSFSISHDDLLQSINRSEIQKAKLSFSVSCTAIDQTTAILTSIRDSLSNPITKMCIGVAIVALGVYRSAHGCTDSSTPTK